MQRSAGMKGVDICRKVWARGERRLTYANDMCNVAYKRHGMLLVLLDEVASSSALKAQEKEEENQQAMSYT